MISAAIVWVGWILYFVLFETVAIIDRKDGDTLSENTRKWFRTDNKKGKATFLTVWIGFAVWFGWHIAFQK